MQQASNQPTRVEYLHLIIWVEREKIRNERLLLLEVESSPVFHPQLSGKLKRHHHHHERVGGWTSGWTRGGRAGAAHATYNPNFLS